MTVADDKPPHPARRDVLGVGAALALGAVGGVPSDARAGSEEFAQMDATALAAAIRARRLSPLEALDAAIARARDVDDRINCISEELYDRARARAETIDLSQPFAGVPYLLKDETDLAGVRRHLGSRLDKLMPVTAVTDAMIQRAEQAGLNIFGRTTMSEFGALPTTETLAYGVTRNPWNLAHTPGGSSGGSAAAVAAGIVPMADAWDGAGSIRIPASNCGLVGLKPTRGRTPGGDDKWYPELNLASHFCVSRSVRDSADLLALVERPDGYQGLAPVGRITAPASRRLKIGVATGSLGGRQPSPEVAAGVSATVRLLEGLGHGVEETGWPLDVAAFQADFTMIYVGHGARMRDRIVKETGLDPAELAKQVEPASLAMAMMGEMADDQALAAVFSRVDAYAERYFGLFGTIDLLLTPVLLKPPVRIGEIDGATPIMTLAQKIAEYADYTMIQNAVGGPAISLPLHWTEDGLPVGMQFAAGRGNERTLLELAFELEQAQPWAGRRPPSPASARV